MHKSIQKFLIKDLNVIKSRLSLMKKVSIKLLFQSVPRKENSVPLLITKQKKKKNWKMLFISLNAF